MTAPLNNLTDTWNNGATTFTGLKYNITNTASASASKIFDWQVGGNSFFSANTDGAVLINQRTGAISSQSLTVQYTSGTIFSVAALTGNLSVFGDVTFQTNAQKVDWGGGAQLVADAAYILAQRNGSNAQTFRIYNTFTNSSNYERGVFDWTTTSNTLVIGMQALGTGSAREVWLVAPVGQVISFVIGGTLYARCSTSGFSVNSGVLTFQGGPGVGQLSADGSTPTLYVGSSSVGGNDFSGTLKAATVTLNDASLTRGAAGIFQFNSSASFSANGSVATSITSVGPTGASTTVQKWLTIKDNGGTTRYIPCF